VREREKLKVSESIQRTICPVWPSEDDHSSKRDKLFDFLGRNGFLRLAKSLALFHPFFSPQFENEIGTIDYIYDRSPE
jgi:hypothetical protein